MDKRRLVYFDVLGKLVGTLLLVVLGYMLFSIVAIAATTDMTNKPTNISISEQNLKLVKRQPKYTLDYEVFPSGTSQEVIWKSSDEKIATISSKGVITTRKNGSVTLTCTSKANSNVTAYCYLQVVNEDIRLDGIEVAKEDYNVVIGKRVKLQFTTDPSNASNKYVKWKIEDKGICSVSDAGYVYGLKEGDTTITGITDDGGFEMSFYINVSESNDATYDKFEEDYPGLDIADQRGVDEGIWIHLTTGQYLFYDNYNGKFTSGWFNQGDNMYVTKDTAIEVERDNDNYDSDVEDSNETIKTTFTLPVLQQNNWYAGPTSWSYLDNEGALVKSNWINWNSRWYYLNIAGELKTGKYSVGTEHYITDDSGACQVGFIRHEGQLYYADPISTKCVKGWVQVADKWYYGDDRSANLQTDMYIATENPSNWYYVQKDGTRLVDGITPDGKSADSNGVIIK